MRDLLRPVHLFGRDYYWHREPGQPLQLVHAAPWPEPHKVQPEDLYSRLLDLYARPLPQPGETP